MSFETNDDSGVYKINDDKYLVQSVDFITPVVDDPYTFGRIAAINSLSDIYAMGGDPITALSILMYSCEIDSEIIKAMMQGACDELAKVKCNLVGGHTVDDNEVKLGFSVTGMITGDKIYKNCTARENDKIIYTKPLGIGVLSTALKGEMTTDDENKILEDVMLLSNYDASKIMKKYDVSACTDITGYGLAGHLYEVAKGSNKTLVINYEDINFLSPAVKYAEMGIIPAGAYFNKQFIEYFVDYSKVDEKYRMLLFDPQTSGGLAIFVSEDDAENLLNDLKDSGYSDVKIIGEVKNFKEKFLIFT
ncbi:selenide, water dikinase [Deferribacter desulfuricans SSM1]|uniref:Selenide, water dikinase n=1 Tax=Deferribacter desulfuricans (strain DSM 14783 / JCM 11476 / NBRC 101012 / SSM1) TaxID=639282 RepID=D3PB73_DEFDS|nr:selenide, water dikinase [Deferribacter desulfuricans SSM1]